MLLLPQLPWSHSFLLQNCYPAPLFIYGRWLAMYTLAVNASLVHKYTQGVTIFHVPCYLCFLEKIEYYLNPSLNWVNIQKGTTPLGRASLGVVMCACTVSHIVRQWACWLVSGEWVFTPSCICLEWVFFWDHHSVTSGGVSVPGLRLSSQLSGFQAAC